MTSARASDLAPREKQIWIQQLMMWYTERSNHTGVIVRVKGLNTSDLIRVNRTKSHVTAQSLKYAILNVRSLTNINKIIENHKLDIIFLTETWLDSNHNFVLNETSPPGFRYVSVPRLNKKGGGVACLFRNTDVNIFIWETLKHFEYLAVHLKSEQSVILLVLYHPPRLNKGFLDDFGELLSRILTDFEYVLITGDFKQLIHSGTKHRHVAQRRKTALWLCLEWFLLEK